MKRKLTKKQEKEKLDAEFAANNKRTIKKLEKLSGVNITPIKPVTTAHYKKFLKKYGNQSMEQIKLKLGKAGKK
jgi:hypothetical protein